MAVIATSDWAYQKVLEKKREMEKERGKVVSMGNALDMLLGLTIGWVKKEGCETKEK